MSSKECPWCGKRHKDKDVAKRCYKKHQDRKTTKWTAALLGFEEEEPKKDSKDKEDKLSQLEKKFDSLMEYLTKKKEDK